jgi:hypothetical protein
MKADVDVERSLARRAPLLYTHVKQAAKGSHTDAIHVLLACSRNADIAAALTRYDLRPSILAEAAKEAFFRGVDSIVLPTLAYRKFERLARVYEEYFPIDLTVNGWALLAIDAHSELFDRLLAERGIDIDDLKAAIDPVA